MRLNRHKVPFIVYFFIYKSMKYMLHITLLLYLSTMILSSKQFNESFWMVLVNARYLYVTYFKTICKAVFYKTCFLCHSRSHDNAFSLIRFLYTHSLHWKYVLSLWNKEFVTSYHTVISYSLIMNKFMGILNEFWPWANMQQEKQDLYRIVV